MMEWAVLALDVFVYLRTCERHGEPAYLEAGACCVFSTTIARNSNIFKLSTFSLHHLCFPSSDISAPPRHCPHTSVSNLTSLSPSHPISKHCPSTFSLSSSKKSLRIQTMQPHLFIPSVRLRLFLDAWYLASTSTVRLHSRIRILIRSKPRL